MRTHVAMKTAGTDRTRSFRGPERIEKRLVSKGVRMRSKGFYPLTDDDISHILHHSDIRVHDKTRSIYVHV